MSHAPQAKRQRVAQEGEREGVVESEKLGDNSKGGTGDAEGDKNVCDQKKSVEGQEAKPDELAPALAKLGRVLAGDKRYVKACEMVRTLVVNNMTEDNASKFLPVFRVAFANSERTTKTEFSAAASALGKALWDNRKIIESCSACANNPSTMYQVKNWYYSATLRNEVRTDDSFQLAKVLSIVQADLESMRDIEKDIIAKKADGIPVEEDEIPNSVKSDRRASIISILSSAYSLFKFPWAKTPVKSAVTIAHDTQVRFQFEKEQRLMIEKWMTTIRARS